MQNYYEAFCQAVGESADAAVGLRRMFLRRCVSNPRVMARFYRRCRDRGLFRGRVRLLSKAETPAEAEGAFVDLVRDCLRWIADNPETVMQIIRFISTWF